MINRLLLYLTRQNICVIISSMEADELRRLVMSLTTTQLEVLFKRWTGADSDAEACKGMSPVIADSTFANWKKKESFRQLYNLLELQGADTLRQVLDVIYETAAVSAVMEQKKLVETDNNKLDSRAIASKFTAIGDILDRVIPKKTVTEHTYIFRLADVVPPRQLSKPTIEGKIIEAQKTTQDDSEENGQNAQGDVPQEEEVDAKD